MPLFGLFNSKRVKKSSNGGVSSTYGRSNTSAISEQDSESVWESVSLATHSNTHSIDMLSDSAPPTSRRIKLPFRRKLADSSVIPPPPTSPKLPQNSLKQYASSSVVEITERLRPPMKSVIFASDEKQAQSTRSLPTTSRTAPDTSSYQDMEVSTRENAQTKKSGGLLSWARQRTKSKPMPPPAESFNLQAFRHLRPEPPRQSERQSSDYSLEPPPARPRPRGDSVASDSSQRISVAAFREAQARRSGANSPISLFRPPSMDTLTTRAMTPTASATRINQPRAQAIRRSTAPESSSSSSYSEEEESDNDTMLNSHTDRKRSITKRPAVRAQSDLGHSQENERRPSAPLQRPTMAIQSRSAAPQRVSGGSSHPPSGMSAYSKSGGSMSTSALQSDKRSLVDFPGKAVSSKKWQSEDSDTSSNSSSDSDSDDAPLATLIGPRRPGSAMSGASNPRPRVVSKPLIDIKTLITDRTALSSSPEPDSAIRVRATNKGKGKEIEHEDVAGLAKLAALARQAEEYRSDASPSPPPPSVKAAEPQPEAAPSKPTITNTSRPNHQRSTSDIAVNPPAEDASSRPASRGSDVPITLARGFVFPRPEPTAAVRVVSPEPNEVDDDDIMPALRFMMPKTYADDDHPASAQTQVAESSPTPEEKRIVPTPIRQRLPPSSFSVTSRPQHRNQQSSNPILTTPSTSAPTSTATSPSVVPKVMSSTAATSAASLASKPTSPRSGRLRSSTLTISTDRHPASDNSSSSSLSPSLPPSIVKRSAPMSTNKSMPSSPVKSIVSTSQSEASSGLTRRPRSRSGSATLISRIPTSTPLNPDNRPQALPSSSRISSRPDTLVSRIPPSSSLVSSTKPKPFVGSAMRRESPASSTGDSSSGRLPLTPADGSDIGSKGSWDRASHLSGGLQRPRDRKDYIKGRSVSFGQDVEFERGRDNFLTRERERERAEKTETPAEGENRRRERRRSEAKAAIELGNVINGRGPIDDSEDEDNNDLVHHNVGPQFNPMMAMGSGPMNFSAGPPGWNNWQQQGQPSPSLMPQDTNFLMAHQQAMMIAKQTYQMAVAQQALAAAGDEWERNSNISGFGGSQGFAPTPRFGGGGPEFGGPNMNMNMGMFGMGGFGGGMGMPNGWPNPSLMVPSAARSAYGGGFGGAQSEYSGGASSGGGWGSRSVYGEAFGPSPGDRASRAFSAAPLGQPRRRQQQEQQSYLPSAKGNRERERRNESSGHSDRADSGGSSSGQLHNRPGPRPRTLTAPASQTPPKSRRVAPPSSPPPSSFRRFNGA